MKNQILAFLDEYCRGMTLHDVREWYADALAADDRDGPLGARRVS